MAKWNEYGLKTGTSARDEVLILDSDTNTNKRITVGDIQEFANDKMLEKENTTLNTEAKTLIGAINEVDAKTDVLEKDKKAIEAALENEKNERTAADAKEKSERQAEIDVERKRINNVYTNKLVSLDDVALVTEEGFFVDALAVKELNSKLANTNTNLAKANTVLENRKPIFIDSASTGSVTFDTTEFLKSGITYAFVVAVNSNLNSGTYAQEITCKLNDAIIGKNGNYYTLTSIFSGKCSKGDRIHITSYKNGGNWSGWGTRCIFIPLS